MQQLTGNSNEFNRTTDDIANISVNVTTSSQELAGMAQQLQELVDEFEV